MTSRPRPRPETGRFEAVGEPSLSYGRLGRGPVVVLVHGLGARWQVFSSLMRSMADEFTFVACDLRGHGESDRRHGHYRLRDFRDDLTRFVAWVSDRPVHVYGHSLGGWIGLSLAAERPDLVDRLVVADTAIYPTGLDPALATAYLAELPLVLRSMAVSLDQLDGDVMAQFRNGEMLAGYDAEHVLRRVRCPTTLLQADPTRGGLMRDDDIARARDLLSRSDVVRAREVGHGLHVEDAALVVDVIRTAFGSTHHH